MELRPFGNHRDRANEWNRAHETSRHALLVLSGLGQHPLFLYPPTNSGQPRPALMETLARLG